MKVSSDTMHIPDRRLHEVRSLSQQHIPQAEIWAYGYRVNGNCYEASDLNLAARFPSSGKQGAFRLSALRKAVSESNVPIFVRIVNWDAITDSVRDEIAARYVLV